jgi:glucosamine--fructose-6-phosphate aminotransferase (isomerizing)
MCGIVGYVGPKKVRPLRMEGLEKLEHRGYDSAGISVLAGARVDAVHDGDLLQAVRAACAEPRGLNVDQPRNLAKTVTVE